MPKLPDTIGDVAGPVTRRGVASYDPGIARVDTGAASAGLSRYGDAQQRHIAARAGIGDAMTDAGKILAARQTAEEMTGAQDRLNDARIRLDKYLYGDGESPGLYSRQGGNAMGMDKEYETEFKKIADESLKGLSPRAAQAAEKSLKQMRQQDISGLLKYGNKERTSYMLGTAKSAADIAKTRMAREPDNLELVQTAVKEAAAAALATAKITGLDETGQELAVFRAKSDVAHTYLRENVLSGDPKKIIQARGAVDQFFTDGTLSTEHRDDLNRLLKEAYPDAEATVAFQSMKKGYVPDKAHAKTALFGFVKDTLENTPVPTPDGKGVARFGINSRAHPKLYAETDGFKNLTEEMALAIYEDYWKAIDGDNLPPLLAARAFDTAFNQGIGAAKRLLKESDGDAEIFNALRRERYETLASENPEEHAKNLRGWINRMTQLEDWISTAQTAVSDYDGTKPPVLFDESRAQGYTAGLSPAGAEKLIKMVKAENEARALAYETNVRQFMSATLPMLQEAGGDLTRLPPDVRAMAEKYQVAQRINGYKGVTNDAVLQWWYDLSTDDKLRADLDHPHVMLGTSLEKWESLKKQQADLKKEGSKSLSLDRARKDLVENTAALYGLDAGAFDKKTSEAYAGYVRRMAAFNTTLDERIDAFREQNNDRDPNRAELQTMVEELAQEQSKSGPEKYVNKFWEPRRKERQAVPTTDIRIEDIPVEAQRQIRQSLFENGRSATRANIIDLWRAYNSKIELDSINAGREDDKAFTDLIGAYQTIGDEEKQKDEQKTKTVIRETTRMLPAVFPAFGLTQQE